MLGWAAPYLAALGFAAVVAVQTDRRTRINVLAMALGAGVHIMFLPHLKILLQVWDCIPQGRNTGRYVMELDRTIYCFELDGGSTWLLMATASGLDVLFTALLFVLMAWALAHSYHWHQETEVGSEQPVSVNLSAWWVIGLKGHSEKHKLVLREVWRVKLALQRERSAAAEPVRYACRRSASDLVLPQVKEFRQDLFVQNVSDVRTRLAQLTEWLWISRLSQTLKDGAAGGAGSGEGAGAANVQSHPQFRRDVYRAVMGKIDEIRSSWCEKSSFLMGEPASVVAYAWELITLGNKVGVALITMFVGEESRLGMRAACAWEFLFVVMLVAVQPYTHQGLNILSMVLAVLLFFIMSTVLVLEMDVGDDQDPFALLFTICKFTNVALVISFVALVVAVGIAFAFDVVREQVMKETLYVVECKGVDPDLARERDRGTEGDSRPRPQHAKTMASLLSVPRSLARSFAGAMSPLPRGILSGRAGAEGRRTARRHMATLVVRSQQDLERGEGAGEGPRLSRGICAQWGFGSLENVGTSPIALSLGLLVPRASPALLRAALETPAGDALPPVCEIDGWGALCLARGGGLSGRVAVALERTLLRSLELVKCCNSSAALHADRSGRSSTRSSKSSMFTAPGLSPGAPRRLRETRHIGSVLVPAMSTLRTVSFAPLGAAEQEVEQLTPQEFLDRHEFLQLPRHAHARLHGRLVLEFDRPDTAEDVHLELCEVIVTHVGMDPELCRLQPESAAELAQKALDLGTSAADAAGWLPDLRLVPLREDARTVVMHVHRQPVADLEEVLILGRAQHQWLVRRREVDSRLGLTTDFLADEFAGATSTLCSRSVWRTKEGSVVVMQSGRCFGGQVELEVGDAQEGSFDDQDSLASGVQRHAPARGVQRITWHLEDSSSTSRFGVVVHGIVFDGMQVRWDGSAHLPASPWVRIVSAEEEGGIPGPDGGLWKFVDRFYSQGQGVLPHADTETELRHQAGAGASALLARTRQDAQPTWIGVWGSGTTSMEVGEDDRDAILTALDEAMSRCQAPLTEAAMSRAVETLNEATALGIDTRRHAQVLVSQAMADLAGAQGQDFVGAWKAFCALELIVESVQSLELPAPEERGAEGAPPATGLALPQETEIRYARMRRRLVVTMGCRDV